jgi:hypothetical protein
MGDSTAGTVAALLRAVHDEAATRDKHTLQGEQAIKALGKGMEIHVFDDSVDLNALESRVWNEGTYLGRVGIDHRLEFDRFVWKAQPIGRRIQAGTADLPLSWVEIKGKIKNGVWLYHLTPRRKPPA